MTNFIVLLKENFIEIVRSKKIFVFSFVFTFLSVISAFTAKYLPLLFEALLSDVELGGMYLFEATVANSYVQFISNFGQISVLLICVMFCGSIVKEKRIGTYDFLKMNGVKDYQIVLSHFVSQVILVTVSYLLSVAVFVLLNIVLFKQIMGIRGFVALIYVYLVMLATICFSLFVGCVCKKRGKAYLIAIIGYFLLSVLVVVPKINVLNPLYLLNLSTELMYYKNYSLSEHLFTAVISLGICVLLVILSLIFVKNNINNKKVITSDNTGRI